eukprot:6198695-Pleurochrysis_carterae.AAC.3
MRAYERVCPRVSTHARSMHSCALLKLADDSVQKRVRVEEQREYASARATQRMHKQYTRSSSCFFGVEHLHYTMFHASARLWRELAPGALGPLCLGLCGERRLGLTRLLGLLSLAPPLLGRRGQPKRLSLSTRDAPRTALLHLLLLVQQLRVERRVALSRRLDRRTPLRVPLLLARERRATRTLRDLLTRLLRMLLPSVPRRLALVRSRDLGAALRRVHVQHHRAHGVPSLRTTCPYDALSHERRGDCSLQHPR